MSELEQLWQCVSFARTVLGHAELGESFMRFSWILAREELKV